MKFRILKKLEEAKINHEKQNTIECYRDVTIYIHNNKKRKCD